MGATEILAYISEYSHKQPYPIARHTHEPSTGSLTECLVTF